MPIETAADYWPFLSGMIVKAMCTAGAWSILVYALSGSATRD